MLVRAVQRRIENVSGKETEDFRLVADFAYAI